MNSNSSFTFHSHFDSLSLQQHALPPHQDPGISRKRKSSYDDISPLVMKTRSGIGLEQEIVYDRTMTLMMQGQRRMMQGQRRMMEEQQQRELLEQQQQQHGLSHQHQQISQRPKESSSEAVRRLFMFNQTQTQSLSPSNNPQPPKTHLQHTVTGVSPFTTHKWTFADCAGESNGCETNRVPGMRDRYEALIEGCSFCQQPQCQFCAVTCSRCQEVSCRTCCVASYDKPDVEYHCPVCRGRG